MVFKGHTRSLGYTSSCVRALCIQFRMVLGRKVSDIRILEVPK